MEIPRATIADLENGRRAHVSVAELLVLAAALEVPPLALMLPVGTAETAEILPGLERGTWEAAKWVTGEEMFPGDIKRGEVIVRVTDLALYRLHDRHEDDEIRASAAAAAALARAAALRSARESERLALLGQAAAWDATMRKAHDALLEVRETMRGRGLVLPGPGPLTEDQD